MWWERSKTQVLDLSLSHPSHTLSPLGSNFSPESYGMSLKHLPLEGLSQLPSWRGYFPLFSGNILGTSIMEVHHTMEWLPLLQDAELLEGKISYFSSLSSNNLGRNLVNSEWVKETMHITYIHKCSYHYIIITSFLM